MAVFSKKSNDDSRKEKSEKILKTILGEFLHNPDRIFDVILEFRENSQRN